MTPPGGGSVSIRPADLLSHAGHVDTVADHVDLARQAGLSTRPGPEAYGRLCMEVPVLLGILQDKVISGIDAAGLSLHDTARQLRTIAAAYESTDHDNALTIRLAGGGQ
jgi:hypothetical protein